MLKARFILFAIAVWGVMAVSGLASAVSAQGGGRVDEDTCRAFEAEKAELAKAGIADDIERGAEWGQANLSAARLKQVGRFIVLEEELTFRCPNVFAAAAVRQMEEQARLKALAALERERLWEESMKKVLLPGRRPQIRFEPPRTASADGVPPLPERKAP